MSDDGAVVLAIALVIGLTMVGHGLSRVGDAIKALARRPGDDR